MKAVRTRSAYQQSLDWLRGQITHGEWKIDERIPTEPELMTMLGVGRNTVREAIKTLTSSGMLEIRHGSGTFVRARTDLGGLLGRRGAVSKTHVFEVRRTLETEAVRLACRRRTDNDLRALSELLDSVEREAGTAGFSEADLGFHLAVVQAAHNPVLADLFAVILEATRGTIEFTEGVCDSSLNNDHHRRVVEAIANRDEESAAGEACGYLDGTPASLCGVLNKSGGSTYESVRTFDDCQEPPTSR